VEGTFRSAPRRCCWAISPRLPNDQAWSCGPEAAQGKIESYSASLDRCRGTGERPSYKSEAPIPCINANQQHSTPAWGDLARQMSYSRPLQGGNLVFLSGVSGLHLACFPLGGCLHCSLGQHPVSTWATGDESDCAAIRPWTFRIPRSKIHL
jgi:hypothetical protein